MKVGDTQPRVMGQSCMMKLYFFGSAYAKLGSALSHFPARICTSTCSNTNRWAIHEPATLIDFEISSPIAITFLRADLVNYWTRIRLDNWERARTRDENVTIDVFQRSRRWKDWLLIRVTIKMCVLHMGWFTESWRNLWNSCAISEEISTLKKSRNCGSRSFLVKIQVFTTRAVQRKIKGANNNLDNGTININCYTCRLCVRKFMQIVF